MAYIDIDGQVRPHTPNDAPGIFTVSGLGIGQCRITFENREMDCHALRNQDDYLVYVPLSCIQETSIQLDEQHISEDIMRSL